MTKAELTGHKRGVVELVSWRLTRNRGAFNHFATAMTKLDREDIGLDKRIENRGHYLIRAAGFKSKLEWKGQFIVLLVR